jgi:hypothetical protein
MDLKFLKCSNIIRKHRRILTYNFKSGSYSIKSFRLVFQDGCPTQIVQNLENMNLGSFVLKRFLYLFLKIALLRFYV